MTALDPALLAVLVVAGIGIVLWTVLFAAGRLIGLSSNWRKTTECDARTDRSRFFQDLEPLEDLLVEFVARSDDLANVLTVVATHDKSLSFARLVHEIRIRQNGSTSAGIALCILHMAGLVRQSRGRFAITEIGREVQRRILHGIAAGHVASANRLHQNTTVSTKEPSKTNNEKIIITAADHAELSSVITFTGKVSERAKFELGLLESELKRAQIVAADDLPPDVITMNSRAELLDLESGERIKFTLVLPADVNINDGKISVLAPLGTAMLGYRVGDEFEWHVPYGLRRLKVIKLHFQPEASLKKAA